MRGNYTNIEDLEFIQKLVQNQINQQIKLTLTWT